MVGWYCGTQVKDQMQFLVSNTDKNYWDKKKKGKVLSGDELNSV